MQYRVTFVTFGVEADTPEGAAQAVFDQLVNGSEQPMAYVNPDDAPDDDDEIQIYVER